MVPRATRRLIARTATKPANSFVKSSVSRTISLRTPFPHAGHCRRVEAGRKGKLRARDAIPEFARKAASRAWQRLGIAPKKWMARPGGRTGRAEEIGASVGGEARRWRTKIGRHT